MNFTHFQPWYIDVLGTNYVVLESFENFYRFMDDLEKSGDLGAF